MSLKNSYFNSWLQLHYGLWATCTQLCPRSAATVLKWLSHTFGYVIKRRAEVGLESIKRGTRHLLRELYREK